MTRAEILDCLTDRPCDSCKFHESGRCERWDCVFEEKPDECEDAISRRAALDAFNLSEKTRKYGGDHSGYDTMMLYEIQDVIEDLPSVQPKQKIGHCKDCKWWKDSDGLYRRGGHAESQCPVNRREVFEGNGYCYMFEPQESEG